MGMSGWGESFLVPTSQVAFRDYVQILSNFSTFPEQLAMVHLVFYKGTLQTLFPNFTLRKVCVSTFLLQSSLI